MRVSISRFFLPFFASILSGVLLFLAFPVYDFGWLGWACLAPLLLAIVGRRSLFAFFLSCVSGFIFFVGIFGWILDVQGYKAIHHVILGTYLGSYVGFFGLAVSFISRRKGITCSYIAAPFIWVSLEFIRSNLSFLALPWPLVGHSQYQNLLVIQIASFAGAYGVSFLVLGVNSTFALIVLSFLLKFQRHTSEPFRVFKKREVLCLFIGAALLFGLAFMYGKTNLSKPISGKEVRISVLQGNIEREKKWNPSYANYIMDIYRSMTGEALKDHPSLIIWPEAATPRAVNMDRKLYQEVKDIAKAAETWLLIGSSHLQKIGGKGRKEMKYRNSAFLIDPEGEGESQRYDKIRLLPFGEYMPKKETIPWSYIGVPDLGSYIPGNEFTVFEFPAFRFGVTICWENIFPDLVREFVRRGAQVMMNITNEGWFGGTASYQFLASNVFRAVENRIYVVRCANTGISCVIDPYGHIVDRVKDKSGRDILVRGVLTDTVVPLDSNTLYTRHGDWFVWLMFPISAFFVIGAFLRKTVHLNSG